VPQHLSLADLNASLDDIRRSPADRGRVRLVVARLGEGEREVLEAGVLDPQEGLIGDRWDARGGRPDLQLTLMNARVADLVAGSRERWPLAGDQLFVDLHLGAPPGTRLAVGTAVVEITDQPHRGCGKFSARFGVDALKFVNSPAGRELNLRGVNARVVAGGEVRPGDAVAKLPG
jgi:MOSC domain